MQFECYVLMKFEAVERYLDLLLMGCCCWSSSG